MPRKKGDKDLRARTRKPSVRGYKKRKYYNGDRRITNTLDVIVFHDPHDASFYKHTCWWCGRVFWANNKHIRLCRDSCRNLHYGHSEYKGGQWMEGSGPVAENLTPPNWLANILGEEI